jgi:hypothetical protein
MRRPLPNIVVLAVDTLRADRLGCYGYGKPTSPEIDTLASESIVFERAFAAGIPTMPAFTTFYTGLHPYRHGIVAHAGSQRLAADIVLLPQLLKAGGYVSVACDNLVAQSEGRGSWFARGYDHYSGFLYKPFSDQSTQLTDRAIRFLEEHTASATDAPLFLFVHYWDPHTPYGPRPPFDTLHYHPGSGPVDMADVRRIYPDYYDAFLGDMRLRHPDDYAYVMASTTAKSARLTSRLDVLCMRSKPADAGMTQSCWLWQIMENALAKATSTSIIMDCTMPSLASRCCCGYQTTMHGAAVRSSHQRICFRP